MGMTYVQKVLACAVGKSEVAVGDVLEPPVDLAMSHENAALVINQFREIFEGTGRDAVVWDPDRIAIVFDHRVPAESSKTATNQKLVREFVSRQEIRKFHDIRGDIGGICHQILPENGYVLPGDIVVGTDSHTTTHGATRRWKASRSSTIRARTCFRPTPASGSPIRRRAARSSSIGLERGTS
ncbi:MAG TPA: aconitase family protein, partial [Acidobacteriota bacterium]|nr:aconitase family protein [Acidobacteriota bacterium]